MEEFSSQQELYNALLPALNVQIKVINKKYNYIKKEDIWNYLKETKWKKDINLTLSEMVSDIMNVDSNKIDTYLKEKIANSEKVLIME